MNIEFRCPGCDKLLSVPESAAGREVRCPECDTVDRIPNRPGVPVERDKPVPEAWPGLTDDASVPRRESAGRVNPYQTPASVGGMPSMGAAASGVATVVDAAQVLRYAFETWKSNLGLVVGIGVVAMVIQLVFNFTAENVNDVWANLAITLAASLVNIFLQIGVMQVHLKLSRGQPAQFTDMFGGSARFLPALFAIGGLYAVAGTIVGTGFLVGGGIGFAATAGFVILASMIFTLVYWPAAMYLVDGNSIVHSFSSAPSVAIPNVQTTILLGVATVGIVLIGLLAFCVGIIAAAPLVGLLWTTAYLMMKGEISPLLGSPRQLPIR